MIGLCEVKLDNNVRESGYHSTTVDWGVIRYAVLSVRSGAIMKGTVEEPYVGLTFDGRKGAASGAASVRKSLAINGELEWEWEFST